MLDNTELCERLNIELRSRKSKGRPRKPKFFAIDFFCGAGGTTRGLIDSGGYVLAGIDKITTCAQTYLTNNGNESWDKNYPEFLDMDIFPLTDDYPAGQQHQIEQRLDKIVSHARAKYEDVPLCLAICAPCQPFTAMSHGMSEKRIEKRSSDKSLLLHACQFVERYRPEYVLSENVAGIAKQRFGGVWQEFMEELKRIGYVTGTDLICASNFGIPQRRKRSILAAARADLFLKAPEKLVIPKKDRNSDLVSVGEALKGLPRIEAGSSDPSVPNHLTRGMNAINLRRISYAPAGGSNSYLEDTPEGDLSLPCHKKVNSKFGQRCFGDTYTRMSPKGVSPTITTKCHSFTNGRFGHPDTTQQRCISMREAARLQSFRDEYVFYPRNQLTAVATQIGNAVPPKLAAFFMSYLLDVTAQSQKPSNSLEKR